MEIQASVSLRFLCEEHKTDLEASHQWWHGECRIYIEPCPDCLEDASRRGFVDAQTKLTVPPVWPTEKGEIK